MVIEITCNPRGGLATTVSAMYLEEEMEPEEKIGRGKSKPPKKGKPHDKRH
jgi:hypothetical protein